MRRAIILAGGAGTRFWPLSRAGRPKQLLKLLSEKTLLEETMDRIRPVVDSVAVSTGADLADTIKKVTDAELIVEPSRQDTAAAIGLCAIRYDPEDILIFLPADHAIHTSDAFQDTIMKAVEKAAKGMTVIGIRPTRPDTAYGYLEPGEEDRVASFREKPDIGTARKYIEEGYLWNAGMFICRQSVLMDLFQKHAPEIHEKLMEIKKTGDVQSIYPTMPRISFDYAIMEKAESVYLVQATFGWNDIGSFDALGEVLPGKNVVLDGKLIDIGSAGNVVHSKKTVALVDCKDMVVIDTEDALLVCPKSSVQQIKDVVKQVDETLR